MEIEKGYDLVIVARVAIGELSHETAFRHVNAAMRRVLGKLCLLKA